MVCERGDRVRFVRLRNSSAPLALKLRHYAEGPAPRGLSTLRIVNSPHTPTDSDRTTVLTFGDIWCLFVSVGPAPHIYQRGERVRGAVCTIHGH